MEDMENIELDRIMLKKSGKNFLIFNNGEVIKKTIKDVYLKFGIENYNENKILNIYVNKNNDKYTNDEYNNVIDIYNHIKTISRFTKEPCNARKYKFDNKIFKYPLKKKTENGVNLVIIRSYLSHNVEIYTKDKKKLDNNANIIGYMADVNIVIKTLWKTSTNIGVIIYTEVIKLKEKIEEQL